MEPIVPLSAMEQIANGIDHAEGICLTPDGTLWVSGEQGQIYRVGADGAATEATTTGGWTLGLAADGEGRIYACDPPNKAVMRWDPAADAPPSPWSTGVPGTPLVTPNWGAFGPDGSFYYTDSGTWKGRDGVVLVVRAACHIRLDARVARLPQRLRGVPGRPRAVGAGVHARRAGRLRHPRGRVGRGAAGRGGAAGHRPGRPGVRRRTAPWSSRSTARMPSGAGASDTGLEVLGHDPEGTVLAAPTNVVFAGPDRGDIVVPNIGRWHVTRFRVEGLTGVPLFLPTREQIGG